VDTISGPMKTATTPEMTTARKNQSHAFTIIELLMVIAIMAIVAGLIVGLAAMTGDSKKINRTQTELAKLVTLIEAYKAKVGVYPPDNPGNPGTNSLLYELAGALRNAPDSNPIYNTPFGDVQSNVIWSTFGGLTGVQNAGEPGGNTGDENRMHSILKDLKKDQFAPGPNNTLLLVVPVDDPNGRRPNPWRYRVGANASHNPESFDLWVDIKVRAGARTIGNWKN
jgi:prepilin-type N-terminal cleavage/methylation domain-containing protein